MKPFQIERLSVRAALAVGFAVSVGLWLYTGYAFARRIDTVRRDAAEVASRYTRAQELLSTVRSELLLTSVRVRDALLNPEPTALNGYRHQIETSHQIIQTTLAEYQLVVAQSGSLERLRSEVEQFHATSINVFTDAVGRDRAAIREVLNLHIVPRREAALAISEEVQALNRRAFISQQDDLAEIHRIAELQSRRQLGAALVVGLGILLLSIGYATRLEARLRRQMERDTRLSGELQEMAVKVISAQEEERRTIARELHDEVGQVLGAVSMELDMAQQAIEGGTATRKTLAEAQGITAGALQTVRNLGKLLHPSALDDFGLPAAIEASLRGLERRARVRTELEQVDLPDRLPRDVELAAYRIVQEGLTNIRKHAAATRCCVRLTQLGDRLLLEVEDDGVGFVEDTDRPIVARGLGLISMRERATRLGGTFNILSDPGGGTRLVVTLRGAAAARA